ncbi:MAG: hypothetical protein P0S94_00970, partial [Simkaniaceae bacterium]|nr:hypothetical protein [Simkaniaceae bacterium]
GSQYMSLITPSSLEKCFDIFSEHQTATKIVVIALNVLAATTLYACTSPLIATLTTVGLVITSSTFLYKIFYTQPTTSPLSQMPPAPVPTSTPEVERPLKEKIKYESLENLGITRARIDSYEQQVAAKNYDDLKKLVISLEGTVLQTCKISGFISWLFPILEQMVKDEVFTDDECSALHKKFVEAKLFNSLQNQHTNDQGSVNYLALLLASPFFRTSLTNQTRGMSKANLESPVHLLAPYIERLELFEFNSVQDVCELIDLFNQIFCVQADESLFFRDDKDFLKVIPKQVTVDSLNEFFDSIDQLNNFIDETTISELKDRALHEYFKTQGVQDEPQVCNDCYALHFSLIKTLKNEGALFDYLRSRVNAIAFDNCSYGVSSTVDQLAAFNAANPGSLNQFQSIVFTAASSLELNEKFHTKIAKKFTDLKSVYFRTNKSTDHNPMNICINSRNNLHQLPVNEIFLVPPKTNEENPKPTLDLTYVAADFINGITFVNPSNIRILTLETYNTPINEIKAKYPRFTIETKSYSYSGLTGDIRQDMKHQITFTP